MPDDVVAVADVDGTTDPGRRTLESLRASHPDLTVLVAGPEGSVATVANQAWEERRCHLLIVGGPVELPGRLLDPALVMVQDDRRVGTVSFFCDDAGFLSFPRPRVVDEPRPAGLDPDTTTRALRTTDPELDPSPIPFAAGPAVLLGADCISAVGPLADLDGPDAVERVLADFSVRGRRRGFFSFLDPSTFCRRLSGGTAPQLGEPETTLVTEYEQPTSPLAVVHGAARAKVCGLHLLVDAARLSPREMGTQVATVGLIRALARRADVARVCVALAEELPGYAASLLDDPKIDARVTVDRDFSMFGRVDVAHRPFQPDSPLDMDACRAVADRTAITVLDLIAYHAVSYQLAPEHWMTYRDWLRRSVAGVDGVVAPTHDVRRQIVLERLPVEPERLSVAELGTDHLRGDEPAARPDAVPPDLGPFLAVLGADYTHKNRDLAVRAHRELCARGHDLALVMAGTGVYGSSRALEDEARTEGQRLFVLPDVTSEERNWLLREASLVLYPTSGEGFGLVPFEAARFGTATAFVPFGPLEELAGGLPVQARDWSPASLAEAAERLLADPAVAQAQVEATVAAGDRLTWDRTAATLTGIYRSLLARPAVDLRPPPAPADIETDHQGAPQTVPDKLVARATGLRDGLLRKVGRLRPPPSTTTLTG